MSPIVLRPCIAELSGLGFPRHLHRLSRSPCFAQRTSPLLSVCPPGQGSQVRHVRLAAKTEHTPSVNSFALDATPRASTISYVHTHYTASSGFVIVSCTCCTRRKFKNLSCSLFVEAEDFRPLPQVHQRLYRAPQGRAAHHGGLHADGRHNHQVRLRHAPWRHILVFLPRSSSALPALHLAVPTYHVSSGWSWLEGGHAA